jgi:DNA-binding transcriptional LysR family regulator
MTLKDINWNQVYYFYEVARKLSMKEAAQTTEVSLPTVSEQIKRLETSLNVILFKRFPRRLELTKEGESLYQFAKEMFDSGMRFVDAISNTNSAYSARVGTQDSAIPLLGFDFLSRYITSFSNHGTVNTIKEANFERLIDRLLRGEFDWALTLESRQSFRVNSVSIGKYEVVFCCARNLELKYESQQDLLRLLPLARTSWDFRLNELIEDHLSQQNIIPLEVLEIDHPTLCFSLVEEGKCLTATLKSEASRYPHLQTFAVGRPLELDCYAVWRKSNERMTAIKTLLDTLKK